MEKSPRKRYLKEYKSEEIQDNEDKKRRHSLIMKPFKITSIFESEIISKICDNIFEDAHIGQINNNSSSKNLFSNLTLKENSDRNIYKKKQKEKHYRVKALSDFSFKDIKSDNLRNDEDELEERFPVHKKSYIFKNILKIKQLKCPRLLEEQWKYEKILLDYNIIDFTSKKI
jgi:hypothetical protein